MQLRNTSQRYGAITIGLHWLVALTIFGLFGLGLWMAELDLYHPWYHKAPALHKGIGLLLFALIVLRLLWRLGNPRPQPLPGHGRVERRAASLVHVLLYLLPLLLMGFGYLISTADGRPVELFGLLEIPATVTSMTDQEEAAGDIHLAMAIVLMAVVLLHVAGALKHHFVDRDNTLRRMLGADPTQRG